MKFFILTLLATVVLAHEELDWSKIKPVHPTVTPRIRIPAPKIVGGAEAPRHAYPHQVAVISDRGSFCGGSIIDANNVLTAAHCVEPNVGVQVVAGAHQIQINEPTQQRVRSKNIVIHEGWDPTNIANDIAIVQLASALELNDKVATIDLNEDSSSLEGQLATVSGWGKPSDQSGGISPILRHVTNDIISNTLCKIYFGSYVRDTNTCLSGSSGRGSCSGDSGGPLIISSGNKRQIGIVSFGSGGGCEIGYPSVYTRVSSYNAWIQANRS